MLGPTIDVHQVEFWGGVGLLAAAAAQGMTLGWERKLHQKPAGMRTMGLVSMGACAFVLLSAEVLGSHQDLPRVQSDPTRVLSYIVVGVGFLGGGAILQSKRGVRGMTTAATVWTAAAIGAATGTGAVAFSLALTVLAFGVLILPRLAHPTQPRPEPTAHVRKNGNERKHVKR